MAVSRRREVGVDELEAVELALADRRVWDILFAEFTRVAIGDDGQGSEVEIFVSVRQALDAQDLCRPVVRDGVLDGRLDDKDVRFPHRSLPQSSDEASVVKTPALWPFALFGYIFRIRDLHSLIIVDNLVALDWYGIDLFETFSQPQLLQC